MNPKINLYNEDCIPALKGMEDNAYDLAICDVPYGIDVNMNAGQRKDKRGNYTKKDWDSIPSKEYYDELLRVSKNQIIWGINYLFPNAPLNKGRIFWYKNNGSGNDFSDGELASHSFHDRIIYYKYTWSGAVREIHERGVKRIHPTQKPVQLYKWLLKNYAKEGDRILDTHAGSFSIGIACYDMKFDLEAYEIDVDYFDAAMKRFNQHKAQLTIF